MLIPFKINKPAPLLFSERQKRIEGHLETTCPKQFEAAIDLEEGNYIKVAENDILAKKYFDPESES